MAKEEGSGQGRGEWLRKRSVGAKEEKELRLQMANTCSCFVHSDTNCSVQYA